MMLSRYNCLHVPGLLYFLLWTTINQETSEWVRERAQINFFSFLEWSLMYSLLWTWIRWNHDSTHSTHKEHMSLCRARAPAAVLVALARWSLETPCQKHILTSQRDQVKKYLVKSVFITSTNTLIIFPSFTFPVNCVHTGCLRDRVTWSTLLAQLLPSHGLASCTVHRHWTSIRSHTQSSECL